MEVFIPNTYIYPKQNMLFECISIYFDFIVHSQFKNLCPKSHKNVYFLSKNIYDKKSTKGNRIGVAPFLQGQTKI